MRSILPWAAVGDDLAQMKGDPESITVRTIGHSTRPIEEFIALLKAQSVALIIDVRTIPRSRRNPQFGIEVLSESLAAAGIDYRHMPSLGGLRHPKRDSPNTGWRNASFRDFADYMQTPEFEEALSELITLAAERRLAVMCAEAVPWRCHRSLIADALTARGVTVEHITGLDRTSPHRVTTFAQVDGSHILYPSEPVNS